MAYEDLKLTEEEMPSSFGAELDADIERGVDLPQLPQLPQVDVVSDLSPWSCLYGETDIHRCLRQSK